MSITYDDDDFDYKNVKPGDISNIFEEDDEEDFEYDETDDDSVEESFEFGEEDEVEEDEVDESDNVETEEFQFDESEELFKGIEESKEEFEDESVQEIEFDESLVAEEERLQQEILDDLLNDNSEDEEQDDDWEDEEYEDDQSDEDYEEFDIQEEIDSEESEEEVENERTDELDNIQDTSEENEDEIEEIRETESDETIEPEEVTNDTTIDTSDRETKDEQQSIEQHDEETEIEESDIEDEAIEQEEEGSIETSDELEESSEEIVESSEETVESDEDVMEFATDQNLYVFMKNHFIDRVKSTMERYPLDSLIKYIEIFNKEEEYKSIFKDIFITERVKYNDYVDFEDPRAFDDLWILTAGTFADEIERRKAVGIIKSDVAVISRHTDKDIIEDEKIVEQRKYRINEEAKYSKYRIDRSVFEIDEAAYDAYNSIFDDKRTLQKDFYESVFYNILQQVMETDRIYDMSNVRMKVIINETTRFIPIVDFSTGIRLICVDTDDVNQYLNSPLLLSRQVPFSFEHMRRNVKVRMLYSDTCKDRTIAVISSLRKIIGFKYVNEKYKVVLNNNYVIAYTTDPNKTEMFDNGDLDTKQHGSSTYCVTKPRNGCIGVIILNKRSEKDTRSLRRNQIRDNLNQAPDVNLDNYATMFVLSSYYIRNDQRLRDPAFTKDQRYVEYTITQYNECNHVMIMDGLQVIVACIIREHNEMYGEGTKYSISFEFDRDNLVSPTIVKMLDDRDGMEPSIVRPTKPYDLQSTYIIPPSRRRLEGYLPNERGRLDIRYFATGSIERRYAGMTDLYKRYAIETREGRFEFIKSRGFEEFLSPAPIVFDIMPYALNAIESGEMIRNIQKVNIESLRDRNSEDSDNLRFKQRELEYLKELGDSPMGSFNRFMFMVADHLFDYLGKTGK